MAADPGPEIEGYVDEHFQDLQPAGPEVELQDPAFAQDLPAED